MCVLANAAFERQKLCKTKKLFAIAFMCCERAFSAKPSKRFLTKNAFAKLRVLPLRKMQCLMFEPFEILYEDEGMIAINKPSGILVHRTKISEDTVFVVQLLRNQIGQRVWPLHRLDRGTSGVLVLAKDSEMAGLLSEQFREKSLEKIYFVMVRCFIE